MRKRDTNALMALFNWEGVNHYIKRLIEWSIMPTRLDAVQDTTKLAGDVGGFCMAPLSSNLQAVVVNGVVPETTEDLPH